MAYSVLKLRVRLQHLLSSVEYHFYTLWLFTASDMTSVAIPSTLFALFNCTQMQTSIATFLERLPMTIFWMWLNLLASRVNNQQSASSLAEDKLNKPWRPIPSGRIQVDQARALGILVSAISLMMSFVIGRGVAQSILLLILGYIYNDLGRGSHRGVVVRDAINDAGFAAFASGALEVATGGRPVKLHVQGMMVWLGLLAAVVATTVHVLDMYDQEGDAADGRRTLPLVIGDGPARWTIMVAVLVWSVVCPLCWRASAASCVPVCLLGLLVAYRIVRRTSKADDRLTARFYNGWLVSLSALPMMAAASVSA